MMLGFYGILFEIYSPGAIFPGVIGGICIILAFYAFSAIPISFAGLGLILLGIIFFILEIKPIFRTSSRSDNGIFLTRHQGALDSTSPAFGAISVKIAG